jgi:hypothetical protein
MWFMSAVGLLKIMVTRNGCSMIAVMQECKS